MADAAQPYLEAEAAGLWGGLQRHTERYAAVSALHIIKINMLFTSPNSSRRGLWRKGKRKKDAGARNIQIL
jgi:hypothetical protein